MTRGALPTDGGRGLSQHPFAALAAPAAGSAPRLPSAPVAGSVADAGVSAAHAPGTKSRGRVDIVRSTAGRGGKTVTVVQGFTGIGLGEKEELARRLRKCCGTGGTVKDGRIEIQGDQREAVAEVLAAAGFRPVFAGG